MCQEKSLFAQLVDGYLTDSDTKLEAIACDIGISRETLWNWRKGKTKNPKCENVRKFAQVLELDDAKTEELLRAARCYDSQTLTADVNHGSRDNALARQDLSEMPNIPIFCGRDKELKTLTQWIVTDNCRLIAILGIGGVGKTALAANLVKHIQNEFQYVIWKSIREAPPVKHILAYAIKFLSNNHEIALPDSLGESITRLIYYLNRSRCLLILDNFESIFQTGTHVESYLKGYEGYGDLIRRVGESNHQSCLVLTSREKPVEVALLESKISPVRLSSLDGLQSGVQDILQDKGLSPSEKELSKLTKWYQGNPLMLNIIAARIKEVYQGDFSEFFRQEKPAFGEINKVLKEQYERLSALEMQIMYWLAINQEPVSIATLCEDIFSPALRQEVPDGLESLLGRSLIQITDGGNFMLQNVVMEYTIEQLINKVVTEIETGNISLFNSHALIKATAKDYVRETQIRLILDAVKDRLIVDMAPLGVENQLKEILSRLQIKSPGLPGYAAGNIFNLLRQMDIDLSGFDFSQLAVWQAYLQGLDLHKVNFAHARFKKSVFTQSFSSVLSVALSPDGQFLATGDINHEVRLWHVESGEIHRVFHEHDNWVFSLAFSHDSQLLATGSQDCTIKIWKVDQGQCIKTLQHGGWVRAVAFSADGRLASVGGDDLVKIWDISKGECIKALSGHTNRVQAVAFSPNDQMLLVSGDKDCKVRIWDIRQEEPLLHTLSGHKDWIRTIAISPDGQTIASGSYDNTIKIWALQTGECLNTLEGHTDKVRSVAFSPDGQTLASGSYDSTIRLWNVQTAQCQNVLQGHTDWVWSIVFSADGQILVSGSNDQTIRKWEVKTGHCLKTLQGYVNETYSVAFSPDGQQLATGSGDQKVRIWDIQNQKCLKTFKGHKGWVRSVNFSNDGKTLVSASEDKTVKIWDVNTGQCQKTLKGHTNYIHSAVFNPDNTKIVSGGGDNTAKIWRVSDGECLNTLEHPDKARTVTCNGHWLATASDDKIVRLWDINNGKLIKELEGHTDRVWPVSFSSDGQKLASAGEDKTIKIWDVVKGQCVSTLPAGGKVYVVVFSSNCRIVVSGSDDNTVKIWDIYQEKCLKTLTGHASTVLSVAISLDGQILASSNEDETIRLWNVNTGKPLMTLKVPKPYDGMNITGVTGINEEQKAALKALGAVEETMPLS